MSISSSIDLQLSEKENSSNFVIKSIFELTSLGWIFLEEDMICYLPPNDNDEFNWVQESISKDYFFKIIQEKEANKELIGVVMTWENSGSGGQFLFYPDKTVSINLSINRQMHKKLNWTNVNWYIERLIPAFSGWIGVESVEFLEHV